MRVVVSEAFRSIRASGSTTAAATMTVLIGMFLLGLFIALGTWVLAWSDETKDKLVVNVYFCTELTCAANGEATPKQIDDTRVWLLRMPEVDPARLDFISKAEAFEIQKERTPELVESVSSNPLPASYKVWPKDPEDVTLVASRIQQAKLPGVEKVNYGKETAERVLQVAAVISTVVLVAVVLLLIASTILIANTIRLSIFARRREIEVMKLVGASNWFVRGPFMIEGLLCGIAGSLLAVLLLLIGKEFALPSLLGRLNEPGVGAIAFAWNAAILLAVGLLLGAAGSGLTMRRFLRV